MTPAEFPLHLGTVEVIALEGLPVDRKSGDLIVVFQDEGMQQWRYPMHRDDVPNIGDKLEILAAHPGKPDLKLAS